MGTRYKSKISYKLKEIPIKQIKVWRDAQARKLDRDGIAELAKSIKNDGLQSPPMVQRDGKGSYLLMSGQRRLAAFKRLKAKTIPVLVLTNSTKYDLDGAKASSVVENLHRNKMDIIDITKACVYLTESIGKAKAAQTLGISSQTLKKYLGFAAVPEKLQQLVPKEISRDDATKLYQTIPNLTKSLKITEKIIPLDQKLRKQYLKVLSKHPKYSHNKLLKISKSHMLQQRIRFELTKRSAQKLKKHAIKNNINPDQMANKILTAWLKNK